MNRVTYSAVTGVGSFSRKAFSSFRAERFAHYACELVMMKLNSETSECRWALSVSVCIHACMHACICIYAYVYIQKNI